MKASVFIATSLDGFIARTNSDIDWLEGPPEGGQDLAEPQDGGYGKFMETVDFLVMGRKTYEKVLSFDVAWPYEKPVVVLTRRPLDIPDELTSSVEAMSGSPADIVAELRERGAQHLYVDGGKTIQAFLNAGLIQRLITDSARRWNTALWATPERYPTTTHRDTDSWGRDSSIRV